MFALSLIVGGALGNFVDRLRFGWVIDFISWHYQDKYVWPTFNLADSYITVGVVLMGLEILLAKEQPAAAQVSPAP
jgi:signal peptidase II